MGCSQTQCSSYLISIPEWYSSLKELIFIMLSHAPNLASQINTWEFVELSVDPIVFPPRILMLVRDRVGNCCIYDPSANYKSLFSSKSYDEAHSWLLEDEYERVDGRLFAEEIL
jgi:hypothetical protein